MKSLLRLLANLLQDCGRRCSADLSRDFIEIERRVKHEGISFCTISLPSFGAGFDTCLERGYVTRDVFKGFKHWKKSSPLPAFMRGLVAQVFDTDGVLLPHPSKEAIRSVRQICYFYKKIELPCTPAREAKAFERYKECDAEVKDESELDPKFISELEFISDQVLIPMLYPVDRAVYYGEHVPRHGPGATAERISGNQKYNLKLWHTRLEEHFPFPLFACPNELVSADMAATVDFVEPDREHPVRVISVPKTLKTPRIIAIEPVCMQYTQQALAPLLMDAAEGFSLAPRHINFRDQSINGNLALRASLDRSNATIDLSEASDRVPYWLVAKVFSRFPSLWGAIDACRSSTADVNGVHIKLKKFASMGSALCFPVESIMFYMIATLGCVWAEGRHATRSSVLAALCEVYVYGDDIIVPRRKARTVMRALEAFGLKVNTSKSFVEGFFRESCGVDAYEGELVTPTYCRTLLPDNRTDVRRVVSAVSLGNQLFDKGLFLACSYVRRRVEALLGPLPTLSDGSALGWKWSLPVAPRLRFNKKLFRREALSYVVEMKREVDVVVDYAALMKFFLEKRFRPPRVFPGQLDFYKSVRPGCAALKRRWIPI